MSEQVFYLVYTSHITPKARRNPHTLKDISETANRINALNGINGFLFFKNDTFLQYLEGEELAVVNLFYAIERDNRHKDVKLITQGAVPNRSFDNWSMYCVNLDTNTSNLFGHVLDEFNTYSWTPAEVLQVVSDMQRFYATYGNNTAQFEPTTPSYWDMFRNIFHRKS